LSSRARWPRPSRTKTTSQIHTVELSSCYRSIISPLRFSSPAPRTKAQARVRIPALGLDCFRAAFDLRVIGHRDQCARPAVVFLARSWMALIPQLRATPFAAVENAQTLNANTATAAGSSVQPQV